MVGVPGRSRGCRTCRRRKKGCDLRRPSCERCETQGLTCGGYDDDRMFVNQTPRFTAGSPSSPTSPDPSDDPQLQGAPRDLLSSPQRLDILLPQSLVRSAQAEKCIELFWQEYGPRASSTRSAASHSITSILPQLYVQDDALRLSALALGSALSGLRRGDEGMLRYGKVLYGRALQELALAVRSPVRGTSEALLAVPNILGLFEILFGADEDMNLQARSWRSHAEGEWAIMKSRGPARLTDGVAHQLFLDSRYRTIIAAFRTRKATTLNSHAWKTEPWSNLPKSSFDSLLDVLAGIPELMQYLDSYSRQPSSIDMERLRSIMKTLGSSLDARLDAWILEHHGEVYQPVAEDPVPIEFENDQIAMLTVTYWATSTLLYQCMDLANAPIPTVAPGEQPEGVARAVPSTYADPAKSSNLYARRITRSAAYFFHPDRGIYASTLFAFPVGVSFMNLSNKQQHGAYLGLVARALQGPDLPVAVGRFLGSMAKAGAGQ